MGKDDKPHPATVDMMEHEEETDTRPMGQDKSSDTIYVMSGRHRIMGEVEERKREEEERRLLSVFLFGCVAIQRRVCISVQL